VPRVISGVINGMLGLINVYEIVHLVSSYTFVREVLIGVRRIVYPANFTPTQFF
jgi:hypothetical protein